MARSRSRGSNHTTKRRHHRRLRSVKYTRSVNRPILDDRRRHRFGHAYGMTLRGPAVVAEERPRKKAGVYARPALYFVRPDLVSICQRRKRRRGVIHALGVAGSKVRKPVRTTLSDIWCKK